MGRYVIGLDVGGGGGRCAVLDLESGRTTFAARPWRFPVAPGTGGLGFDVPLDTLWEALAAATREAVREAEAPPEEIAGLAVTSLRMGNVVLDDAGEALLAVPNRDARAAGPGLVLAAEHGERLYETTGRWPLPIHTAARLRWLRDTDPDRFARAARVVSLSDWVAWRLSGELATDPTQAAETLLFDVATGAWSEDWLERLALPASILPPVHAPGTRLGDLRAAAADDLGLVTGTPVAVGAADTQCALVAGRVIDAGAVGIVAGSTVPVQQVVDTPAIDPERRLWTSPHAIDGRFVLESNAGPLGETVAWLARLLYPDSPVAVARLFGEARTSVPGARGLLSSLGADVMNARAMALPVGHLTLSHLATADEPAPRRHLARAFVEGMACGLRANLEQIEAVSAHRAKALHLTGGLSRSDTFGAIVSDLLERPVRAGAGLAASAIGAALCAAVAAGRHADLARAAEAHARIAPGPARRFDPDRATAEAEVYTRWTRLRAARSAADAEASALALPFALAADPGVSSAAARHRPKVLVAADFDERALARLEAFADVTYAPFRRMKRMLSGPALVEALAGFDVFVTEIDLVDAASLAELPDLRVVASCRGDAVNVDLDACTAFGIPVLNAPGRNADAVADLAIAFMLMLARKLPEAERFLQAPGIVPGDLGTMGKAFATLQGRELWEKTIGLVGLGAVGRKVAARLAGFGARVLAFDPFVDVERGALADVEIVDLDTLLAESDFVSLHAAVNLDTMGLIGANAFEAMKPEAYLINTARAALVDEEAMIEALRARRIAGAALDTFAIEPPGSDHPLMALDNVLSTPHIGGNTADVPAHQGEIVVDDLERLLDGEVPRHAVNPDVLAGFAWDRPRREPAPEELERLRAGPAPAVSDLQKKPGATAPPPASATRRDAAGATTPDGDAGPRAHMERLVQAFLEDVLADASLSAFAAGQDVTLHFVLEDLDLPFYLQLGAGDGFRAALGDPRDPADVQLRLRAAVLDGMFTGAENPMEAAMEGRLAFTGDAAKAMTLQHMQSDLERLYQGARARVGAPTGLAEASAAAPAPARAEASRLDADDPRHAIVQTVRELYDAGLVTATGGNVSTRTSEDDSALWITPSRLFKGDLAPEAMVRIDLDGRSLDPGSRSPSSEWDLHCAIYRRKPEARAVIHAHAPKATILANAGLPFLPISTEAAFFGELPRVPFIMPGTHELARATADAMGDGWAALLVNHGLIVAGRSLRSAADMAEIIERTADVLLGCHAVGRTPPVLPDDVVATLRKMGDLVA